MRFGLSPGPSSAGARAVQKWVGVGSQLNVGYKTNNSGNIIDI